MIYTHYITMNEGETINRFSLLPISKETKKGILTTVTSIVIFNNFN